MWHVARTATNLHAHTHTADAGPVALHAITHQVVRHHRTFHERHKQAMD